MAGDTIAILDLKPWHKFRADIDEKVKRAWLATIAKEAKAAFKKGAGRRAVSKDGGWPGKRTGGLHGSIKSEVHGDSVVVSTSMPYSGYLRYGTSRMGRRKMSDTALEIGIQKAEKRMEKWVQWVR